MMRSGFMDDYTVEPENKRPKRNKNWLLPIIIGIVVGAVLMFVLYPNISNISSITDNEESENEGTEQKRPAKQAQLQVDVSTQITDIVDEISETVVGVTNIQQRADFWSGGNGIDEEAGT